MFDFIFRGEGKNRRSAKTDFYYKLLFYKVIGEIIRDDDYFVILSTEMILKACQPVWRDCIYSLFWEPPV